MLSRAPIWAPQAGHCDRSRAKGIPRGTRWATAVAKLPTANPARNAIKTMPGMDAGVLLRAGDGVERSDPGLSFSDQGQGHSEASASGVGLRFLEGGFEKQESPRGEHPFLVGIGHPHFCF